MAVVGVGIAVYRWPWTVTTANEHTTVVTQFRRAWNGKAVKDGRELTTYKNGTAIQNWYVDGDLRRQRHETPGSILVDQSYLGGKQHGPYHDWYPGGFQHYLYRHGKLEGISKQQTENWVLTAHWRDGQYHGAVTWHSLTGQLLEAAEFEHGRLVGWNALPVREGLLQWADAHVTDAEVRQNLLLNFTTDRELLDAMSEGNQHGEQVLWVGNPPRALVFDTFMVYAPKFHPDRPAAEIMLEWAFYSSSTFAYRFNRMCLVDISTQQREWKDRTRVNDIHFAQGSMEEEFWLSPGVIDSDFAKHAQSRLKGMLYFDGGIPIAFDTMAIDHLEPPYEDLDPMLPAIPRVRRDMIGEYLDERGYYCELHDGKLVFKPHPETLQAAKE